MAKFSVMGVALETVEVFLSESFLEGSLQLETHYPSPELLVALDPLGCKNLDLSCRKALFYPCPAWLLPCPGAVRCRRVWYPRIGFFHPFSKEECQFTVFWTKHHSYPEGAGRTCELSHRSSVRRVWELQKHTYFRGRYCNAGNEFALSQHPDKMGCFLIMFSASSLFKFSRSIFLMFPSGVLKLLVCRTNIPKGL